MTRSSLRAVGACLGLIVLAGCAGTPSPLTPHLGRQRAHAQVTTTDRLAYAIVLMGGGYGPAASVQLGFVLAADPKQPLARLLLNEIEQDPKIILGEHSHPYRVKPGETLTSLSQRFLGDGHLFFALARLNAISVPDQPLGDRTILIPGAAAATEVRRPAHPRRAGASPVLAAAPSGPHDGPRARRLRGAALVDMNSGRIDAAVALLGEAASLDPGNALIDGDLQRARRLQQAVRAPR